MNQRDQLREALRRERAVQAGWAFSVPEDGREQWLDLVAAAVAAALPPVSVYVWEGQLGGTYTGGLIVAVAPDLDAAKEAVRVAWDSDIGRDGLERALATDPDEVAPLAQLDGGRAWLVDGA